MEDPHELVEDTDTVLQPFLEMVEHDSNVSTVRAVVLKVLSHPQLFCGFDQLHAKIANANNGADAQLLATLELFSYGVYKDYIQSTSNNANANTYLPLNDTQLAKLQQLTVLSCVQDACNRGDSTLSYSSLGLALGISLENNDNDLNNDRRWLEQIIISGLYARIWNGRLCQKSQQLLLTTVPPCISRDVKLAGIPDLLGRFQALRQNLEQSSEGLETAHTTVSLKLEQTKTYWKSVHESKKKAESQVLGNSNANASGTVRVAGWPESSNVAAATRRSGASRQSKRSRGGLGGSFTEPFQRF